MELLRSLHRTYGQESSLISDSVLNQRHNNVDVASVEKHFDAIVVFKQTFMVLTPELNVAAGSSSKSADWFKATTVWTQACSFEPEVQ